MQHAHTDHIYTERWTKRFRPERHLRLSPNAESEAAATRVLVVEDDQELRRLVAQTLEAAGYVVDQCVNGMDFLRHVCATKIGRLQPPDLIITDHRMPGRSGLDVVETLRRADWSTPVVLITAFPDRPVVDEAHRLGVVATLAKPFELADLLDLVDSQIPPTL